MNTNTEVFTSGYSLIETDEDRQIKAKVDELKKIRDRKNKSQSAIKAIIGGGVLAHAIKDDNFARSLITAIEKTITKDSEIEKITPTLNNLRKKLGIAVKDMPTASPDAPETHQTPPSTTNTPINF